MGVPSQARGSTRPLVLVGEGSTSSPRRGVCTQGCVHTHGNGGESAGLLTSTHTRGTHLSTNVEQWTDEYLVELAGRFRAGLGSTCRGFARVAHTPSPACIASCPRPCVFRRAFGSTVVGRAFCRPATTPSPPVRRICVYVCVCVGGIPTACRWRRMSIPYIFTYMAEPTGQTPGWRVSAT